MDLRPRQNINQNRRKFLKWAAIGGGSFAVWKLFGAGMKFFGPPEDEFSKETLFENFRISETGKNITIYEKSGKEIIVIEKDDEEIKK
jgi:hypothetical protein